MSDHEGASYSGWASAEQTGLSLLRGDEGSSHGGRGMLAPKGMSDSDHHHGLPTILRHRDSDVVQGSIRCSKEQQDAALAAATILDEQTLRSIDKCSLILHDITLIAPNHEVRHRDEDAILRIAADIHVLGQWVHSALAAFSDDRRVERRIWEREYATSPPPAQPLPQPPQPTAPIPAPAKLRSRATPDTTRPVSKLSHMPLPSVPEEPATLTATMPPTPRATPQPESPQRPRVIVRYGTTPSPPLHPHPKKIVHSLNSAFGRDLLAAVSYSRDDQLVLHTKAPCTAQQLLTHDKIIRTTLDSLLYPTSKQRPAATFDTGQTWSKLVLHQVPLPVWTNKSTIDHQLDVLLSDFCASNGVNKSSVCRFRTLCSLDSRETLFRSSTERAPRLVSILLCLTDHDAAERILRSGVIVQSAFCRTSTFRPRSRPDATAAP